MKVYQEVLYVLFIWMLNLQLETYAQTLPVLPYPKHAEIGSSQLDYPTILSFYAAGAENSQIEHLSQHWQQFINESNHPLIKSGTLKLVLYTKAKSISRSLKRQIAPYATKIGKEGYVLIVNSEERVIAANTEAGLFYGLQTLKQLTRAHWNKDVLIADWPDYAVRAIYDDISRGPISSINFIKEQIRRMAEIKINYLSFYIEHVVQPFSHPDFAPENGKLTIPQIKELSSYAAQYHMQLIGSFQSFGHFEKILSLPKYQPMGETNTLISPLDPNAREFLTSVITELCAAFSAPWFNVNCDETFDLNKGKSKKYIDSVGLDKFYTMHLNFLYNVLKKNHKQMMMWGDEAIKYGSIPDLLPKDVIYLTWEYGDQKSYQKWINPFASRGLHYMVCPGILNTNRLFPDMIMAKNNISNFLKAGKENKAMGAFTTIWDDGSMYLFSGVWYGVYMAAETSWNVTESPQQSFNSRYSQTAFSPANNNYVPSLLKLMDLRRLPVTYELNDQMWYQNILPEQGRQLLIDNTDVPKALKILDEAQALIDTNYQGIHSGDQKTLLFTIKQYQLLLDSRVDLEKASKAYQQACKMTPGSDQSRPLIQNALHIVETLQLRYSALKIQFQHAWNEENQPYWLNVVLTDYNEKIKSLDQLQNALQQGLQAVKLKRELNSPESICFSIHPVNYSFFENWLIAGPFPTPDSGKLPAFLYSENEEYNQAPSPGDFSIYQGKKFRWLKYTSDEGGMVDLNSYFHSPNKVTAYAYCKIHIDSAQVVDNFLSGEGRMQLYCNGSEVQLNQPISLKAGSNDLLIKIGKEHDQWNFNFHLPEEIPFLHHKHKYYLNLSHKSYEAE